MSILYREYHTIAINGKPMEIRFSISFNKDQFNWATNERKVIGYQVSATPVERTQREGGITIESFGAFTWFNDNLIKVDRQSSKRLLAAKEELKRRLDIYLQWFYKKYNKENEPV